jgi:hypothetical protein
VRTVRDIEISVSALRKPEKLLEQRAAHPKQILIFPIDIRLDLA